MASGDSITYTKRESSKEIFPDSKDYDWGKNKDKSIDEKSQIWFKELKKRFLKFEHDPKSSIYRYYDHDYDDPKQRTIKMPSGNTASGNINRMTEQLPEALLYRLKNFNKPTKNGWNVFEKITGKYDVEAADEETLKERLRTLLRFCELIKEDEFLSTYDPLTNKEAITQVNATGDMDPIEYTFPLGIENTDFLHYLVYEPEVIKAKIEDDKQIEDIVRYEILNYIDIRGETLMTKRGIGIVMSKHGNVLRPHIGYIQSILGEIVDEYNTVLEEEGESAVSKLLSIMDLPQTQEEVNEESLVETYKKISVSAILKKIKGKALLKRLNRIKPPSEGKAGGVTWPVSAGGNYMLWITTDPFEMLTKSTGRKWSERNASCENWDGCYAEGPVSDIKYGNCIVWVYKQGEEEYRHEIGRFLLRWGDAYKSGEKIGVDIGVEAQVYPKDPRESPWGFNLLGAIGNILKDRGLLNYDNCQTPYKYLGYSDKAGGGKMKIGYDSKIFLKGQGRVEVGNANALASMASDEGLSYADSGYVLNYGNAQALLALSQNPVVWIYENTIRRLFTRALDIDEGSQIIRFLMDSSVANFDWIVGTLDTMEIFDERYYDLLRYNQSYLNYLMRSPLCTDMAHEAIIESHSGYDIGNLNMPIWATGYLDILKTSMNQSPILTTVPANILEFMTNEVIAKQFMADFVETPVSEDNPVKMVDVLIGNEGFYDFPSPVSKKLLKKYIFKMEAMKQLIYQPKLPLKSYAKLLTNFSKIWGKRLNDDGPFDVVLNKLRNHFAITLCLPLQNYDDWGYLNSFAGVELNLKNTDLGFRNISTIVDGDEIRYPIFSRQSAGTVRRMLQIFPELGYNKLGNTFPADDNDGVSNDFVGLLIRNVRDAGSFKELYNNPQVPKYELLNRLTNPSNRGESIINPFLNAKTYAQIFKAIDVKDYGQLELSYDWESVVELRESLPSAIVDELLRNFNSIKETLSLSIVATWLRTPKQFLVFTQLVMSEAIGYYSSYSLDDMDIDFGDIDFDEHFSQIENIELLSLVAYGGFIHQVGLATNPFIPDALQYELLRVWPKISQNLGGEYEVAYTRLLNQLSQNPNISAESVDIIIEESEDYLPLIMENARVSMGDELVKNIAEENPSLLLTNYNLNIRSYMNVYQSWINTIKQKPSSDKERFIKSLEVGSAERIGYIRSYIDGDYANNFSSIRGKISEEYWLRFWRGGNFKKKMNMPSDKNVAPYNPEKNRPMALVDSPIPIGYEQIIINSKAEKDDEGNIILTDIILTYIESITEENGLINVVGKIYQMVEDYDGERSVMPENIVKSFNSYEEMYGFIPEERRGEEGDKWNHDFTCVLFDEIDKSSLESLPDWRMETSFEDLLKSLQKVFENPKLDDERLLSIIPKSPDEHFTYSTKEYAESNTVSIRTWLEAVDKSNRWTPEIINKFVKTIFCNVDIFRNYSKLSPTNLLFDATLLEDEQEIYELLDTNLRGVREIQLWILGVNFEDTIPIQYVYSCITLPHINAEVKGRAKQIRQKRLAEYLTLMRRDDDIQVNDAEEQHSYEWRIFNSQVNNILINYCEVMYPNDIKMQEKLMDDIVSGNTHIGIEQMSDALRGVR
tara:strand:- start:2809 stop:7626 length:4818 start_codon:yes stop_codon:yes gene_type:complete